MNIQEYQLAAEKTSPAYGLVATPLSREVDGVMVLHYGIVPRDQGASRAAWRLANGIAGLGSESCELVALTLDWDNQFPDLSTITAADEEELVNLVKKELGDIAWYIAESASAMGFNLGGITNWSNVLVDHCDWGLNALQVAKYAGGAADYFKKLAWHDKTIDWATVESHFACALGAIAILAKTLGFTIEDVLDANIAKLSVRYEKGFSGTTSEARVDLAAGA
jgi:hypothetical protein